MIEDIVLALSILVVIVSAMTLARGAMARQAMMDYLTRDSTAHLDAEIMRIFAQADERKRQREASAEK